MTFSPPPRVELDDALLRAWTPDDAPLFGAALARSDAHLRRWTPWVVDGKVAGLSLDERLARHAADFATGVEWVYGLFSRDGREVLGGAGLYPRIGPGGVEIGYWLAAGHTGRGLATRAADALARLAFDTADVDRVEIHCARENAASARVPARLGFQLVSDAPGALMVWRRTRG
jgi:RimJ/RimL family protein N-acetyltransferase